MTVGTLQLFKAFIIYFVMHRYGVLGGRELLNKTYKNLEQRVHLECDGHRIALPSLQGMLLGCTFVK